MQEAAEHMVDRAHAFLHGNTRGDLRFDEHMRPVKYIVCADGRLALPVMVAMLQTVDTVLFVPSCEEGAMEVQVTLTPFQETGEGGAAADRWRIYHGEPPDVRWAHAMIDAARFEDHVVDGEALMRSNPLAEVEARLCRDVNAQRRDGLKLMVRHFAEVEIDEPMLVGIDPAGFDVRGRFEVYRISAGELMTSSSDVMDELDVLATEARGS